MLLDPLTIFSISGSIWMTSSLHRSAKVEASPQQQQALVLPWRPAGRVEAVGAARQHAELVSLRERRQADGALLVVLSCPSFQFIQGRRDGDGGQRLDGRLSTVPWAAGRTTCCQSCCRRHCRRRPPLPPAAATDTEAPPPLRKAHQATSARPTTTSRR